MGSVFISWNSLLGGAFFVDRKFVLDPRWCPLVVVVEYLRCFGTSYSIRPIHAKKKPVFMDFIPVDRTGFHIYWDNKLMISFFF